MKKRILCLALTVAMLLSFVAAVAVPANAASDFKASAEMIEVLKKWEGFSKKPYWDYKQWTVGYGTRVPDGKLAEYQANGIPEDEAQALLMEFLDSMGSALNEFFDKFGLTMNQGQFDALLSLSYNCGTSWLYKPSTLRTAVIEGWTGDDLLFAFAQWSNSGDETIPGLIRRRLAEANMYLNGNYAVSPPTGYCYVQFNANGGESEIVVQGYDVNVAPQIRAVPTYEGLVFEGWYTDATGGEKITNLDAGVKNYTLYAHWSAGEGQDSPKDEAQEIAGTAVNYEKQIATGVLHSFQQPVKGALVVDAYSNGELVKIVAEYTDASGVKWGQVSKGGWINLSYTKDFDENEESEGPGVKVTVTATDVNLRRGPSTSYAVVGQADKGDTLEITSTANGSGYLWGKSSKGWIALKYTDYNSVVNDQEDTKEETQQPEDTQKPEQDTKPEDTQKPEQDTKPGTDTDDKKDEVVATGKVKLQSGMLNVRSGPSTAYGTVGALVNGTAVELLEIKAVGAVQWGRTEKGWICLTYVALDTKEEAPEQSGDQEDTQKPEQDTGSKDETQEDPKEDEKEDDKQESGTNAVTGKIVLSSGKLNIRSAPGTNHSVVGWLSAGETVTITEQKTVGGRVWGKISKGWICMDYVNITKEPASGDKEESAENQDKQENTGTASGVVSSSGSKLRVRTGPGSDYPVAGYLNDGDKVEILEQKTVNGTVWGRVSKGWISLNFVKLNQNTQTPEESDKETEDKTVTGTVTATCLHVRSGAGTNNKIVGRLYTGEKVTILETKDVSGVKWGKISTGWICMDYVKTN